MSRRQFLGFTGVAALSIFGVTRVLSELKSRAAGLPNAIEPETGTLGGGATAITNTAASGGKALKFGSGLASDATPWLPFDMPTKAALAGTDEVGIHQMMNYTVSVDNAATEAADYWSTHWVTNGATVPPLGKPEFDNVGGECRDRPIFRPKRPDADGVWQMKDTKDIIRWCQDAGIDFCAPHTPGGNTASFEWKQLTWWIQASLQLATGFKVAPWVDCSTSITENVTVGATALADLYTNPATKAAMWQVNGRPATIVYSPTVAGGSIEPRLFNATSLTTLKAFKDKMIAQGVVNPFWWPVYQSGDWSTLAPQYASVFDAASSFGNRDLAVTSSTSVQNRGAAPFALSQLNYMWMAPGSRGATVPRGNPTGTATTGYYWESGGFGQLLASTKAAVEVSNVKRLMWNTGNDFPEGSFMFPSKGSGRNWLDILAFMNVWYKLKRQPTIVRDAVYVAHRKQLLTATYTSGQTKLMSNNGTTAGTNVVDVLAFLTAPANVVTEVGGVITTTAVQAGMQRVTVQSRVGSVSAKIVRGTVLSASVTSRHTIVSSIPWQDLEYYVTGSLETATRPALYTA